jgi:integrase
VASIYKRGDGQYEVNIRRNGYPRQRRTFGTKARAIAWGNKVESEMDAGVFQQVKETRKMPLHDLIVRYKQEIAPKLADHLEKCRIADEIDAEFGRYGLLNLEPKDIAKWRDELLTSGRRGKRSASTVNHYLNTLSGIYTAGMKEFHLAIPFNPCKLVTRLKEPPARTQRVKDEVVEWLIAANRASNEKRRELGGQEPFGEFESWLRLAMEGAMRRSEIARLEVEHIDLENRTAHLPKTKNGEPRTVPLSSKAVAIIRAMLERNPKETGRLFTLTVEGFKSAFRRARADVVKKHPQVKDVRFHDTRREATTRLAKKLPNVVELAAVTGHKKLDQLKRYYQPDPAELAKKLD